MSVTNWNIQKNAISFWITSPMVEGLGTWEVFFWVFFDMAKPPKSRTESAGRESKCTVSWYKCCKRLFRVSTHRNPMLAWIIISSVKVIQDGRDEDNWSTHCSMGTVNEEVGWWVGLVSSIDEKLNNFLE